MPSYFSKFTNKLNADGLKKLDVYTLYITDNLDYEEKHEAFKLLTSEMTSHTPAILTMNYIDKK